MGSTGCYVYLVVRRRFPMDLFTREADGRWVLDAFTDIDASIPLESIGCTLKLREVYDKVEFGSLA